MCKFARNVRMQFAVALKVRYNASVNKEGIINAIAGLVAAQGRHTVGE